MLTGEIKNQIDRHLGLWSGRISNPLEVIG
jgi:hypothetical protein